MLVVSRRLGEKVIIGQDVVVVVLGVEGYKVKLGIEAPREVTVHREEVYERIKAGEPR